ncbi:MAG: sialate O-acetylesterase [Planctomycetes bacterium]|nr:sialate O-acetylesterase [Planctomycetota bacterium]MCB9891074.1 sialate O-acetylesterase [Planctomycetota bacterium]MCB9916965.1 sialate O-acetylesterase [Planctomycetota bacterium]
MTRLHLATLIAVCPLLTAPLKADVKLPALFSDSMVLQRDMPVPVWGTADASEEITVSFAGQQVITKAGADGKWRIDLAPITKVGGPHVLLVKGKNRIEIKDVLVGEVWICSGQSNMEWRVRAAADAKNEIAAAKHPKIRLFVVPNDASPEAKDDVDARWERCTPDSVKDFSAVGYAFGRFLHENLHSGLSRVPVGLIDTTWGGTPAEAWMPPEDLADNGVLTPILDRWKSILEGWPEAKAKYEAALAEWKRKREEGVNAGNQPRMPLGATHQHRPGNLWRGMVQPLVPFAIRGAVWYQGETNAARAEQYGTLFPRMIESWRAAWGRDFPFYWVQLANFDTNLDPRAWAELREAQSMTKRLPNSGQAITIDIGTSKNIHPGNKREVGRRLALLARRDLYGEGDLDAEGPVFKSFTRDGNAIVVEFSHADEGLELREDAADSRPAFELAEGDGEFVPAKAKIVAGKLRVEAEGLKAPTAIRYAWFDDPAAVLFDKNGLPATPFRSDDRPRVTHDKR